MEIIVLILYRLVRVSDSDRAYEAVGGGVLFVIEHTKRKGGGGWFCGGSPETMLGGPGLQYLKVR